TTPGDPACKQIVPEFFYNPTKDAGGTPLVVSGPTCNWNNPGFADVSDHFGVVGLPESAGEVSEESIREVFSNTAKPCLTATLGERFNVLEGGLTENETDEALWQQISVSYDGRDSSHPPFASVYGSISVPTKPHELDACSAAPTAELGWGACNSRRYV